MHLFAKNFPAAVSPAAMRLSLSLCLLTAAFGHSIVSAAASPVAQISEPRVTVGLSPMQSPLLRRALPLGPVEAQTQLRASLLLPLRSQSQLAELIRRQYTPGDPLYHQFLKPQDFTARFGPTPADYAAVAEYARAQGLTITGGSAARTLLNVSGPAAAIEAAFGVQMGKYRLETGREVFANRAAPRLPRSIAQRVSGVAGLNNLAQRRPMFQPMSRALGKTSLLAEQPALRRSGALQNSSDTSVAGTEAVGTDSNGQPLAVTGIGSGTLGGLIPNDIKAAYSLSDITPLYGTASTTTTGTATLLSGTSQRIGLYELDGYLETDIAKYVSTYSLPTVLTGTAPNLTNVLLPKSTGAVLTAGGQSEVTLDIDMVFALAPTASVYVYEDNQTLDATASLSLFDKMATDTAADGTPLLQVISCSWGEDEVTLSTTDSATQAGENTVFQQMAAQGQSLFCASGDNGAYDDGLTISVDDPASQPFATGVGGTTLSYTKPATNATTGVVTPGTYVSESAWGNAADITLSPLGAGGGGGVSSIWAKPTYQEAVGSSPTRREVPDVSLNADPNTGYELFVNGTDSIFGGTSAAAPLWASYMALVNQQRATNGLGTIGFVNPVIYPLGTASAYTTEFHDVTTGTNLFYEAAAGYDDATGLGSFIGDTLLAALSFNANQGTGTATLTGTVTDAANPATLLAGATVTVSNATTRSVIGTTTTAADGTFTLSVPSGVALSIAVNASTITGASLIYLNQTLNSVTLTAGQSLTESIALNAAHTYSAGLQMISAPFDYTGVGDFATLFGLTASQADTSPRLTQWQPALVSYVFYPTAPADTLRLGQGYWVQFPVNSYLHLAGTPLTTTTYQIPLKKGWNQIGDPFTTSAPLSSATVLTASGATEGTLAASHLVQPTLYSYNTSSNSYVALNVSTDTLDPYVGYWVYALQPATLSVTTGAPPPPI